MSQLKKVLGSQSKYERSLPYSYMATVHINEKGNNMSFNYFDDTICGLIEYLDENHIKPKDVQLSGVYRKKEISLEMEYCLTPAGKWISDPTAYASLNEKYDKILENSFESGDKTGEQTEVEEITP